MSPTRSELAPAPDAGETPVDRVVSFHRRVEVLCVARLRDALDPETQLFDRQLRHGLWDRTRGTEDLTGTAICLVGLHRAGVDPGAISLVPHHAIAALVERSRARRYPGALGLVLWANAVWDGLPLPRLLEALDVSQGRLGTAGAPLTTMESAWLVSGHAPLRARLRRGAAPAPPPPARPELRRPDLRGPGGGLRGAARPPPRARGRGRVRRPPRLAAGRPRPVVVALRPALRDGGAALPGLRGPPARDGDDGAARARGRGRAGPPGRARAELRLGRRERVRRVARGRGGGDDLAEPRATGALDRAGRPPRLQRRRPAEPA